MRFPFLATEYTNICAFATFCESSAVELLTEPKVLRPRGRPPRPGSGRCAGVSPLPSAVPPDPSPLRLAVPRLTAARTSGPCRDPATPVAEKTAAETARQSQARIDDLKAQTERLEAENRDLKSQLALSRALEGFHFPWTRDRIKSRYLLPGSDSNQ